MTLEEIKLEIDKDIPLLSSEQMKKLIEKVKRKDLPVANRMRRQLIAESVAIIAISIAAAILTWIFSHSLVIAIIFAAFAILFVGIEIAGFRSYWKMPFGLNMKEMYEFSHSQFQRIAKSFTTLNVSLGLVLLVIIFVDSNLVLIDSHYTNLVPWKAMIMMFAVKIMAWLFSAKWTAREKQLRLILEDFKE